jgi:hypothetical protein
MSLSCYLLIGGRYHCLCDRARCASQDVPMRSCPLRHQVVGEWGNGSPGDFDSSSPGSSPGSPVIPRRFAAPLSLARHFVVGLCEHMFVSMIGPRYSESEARRAIAVSSCYAEALRRLGMRPAGGNHLALRKYAESIWEIPTDHFDPEHCRNRAIRKNARPLNEILVEYSTYSRGHLKSRLFKEGVKQRKCELCGQDERWRGRRMALILDHVNGIANDHRLKNLRIVCPNCAATLDTHCGRQNRLERDPRQCLGCNQLFWPAYARQRYCSRHCAVRRKRDGNPSPARRKVDRPPHTHLLREIAALGYAATGRRYGVSDNAVRKWVKQYERECASANDSRVRASREASEAKARPRAA